MHFPISGVVIDPILLVSLGFVVGILGGLFGVGGSFLAGPALFALGLPMNFVVGTDLTHIVGKSIVATRKHWSLGSIDFRLAGIMVVGTIAGVQAGVEGIELLKKAGKVVGHGTRTISGHGKVLTLTSTVKGADGKSYTSKMVFDKQ